MVARLCPACGAPVEPAAARCGHCGTTLADPTPPPARGTSRIPQAGSPAPPRAAATAPQASTPAPEDARVPAYAAFWRRAVAALLDQIQLMIILLVVVFTAMELGLVAPDALADEAQLERALGDPIRLLSLVVPWLYFTLFEAGPWQATPGKRLMRLVVCDLEGRRIGWGRANLRFFAKILSGAILLLGYLMAAFTPRRQALHDLIARTLVLQR